jgi:long-chain acyl-CoA synthetase
MLNLAAVLEDSARRYPDRTAVVLGERRMSYAEINMLSNMVANLLVSRGIGKGDKVALSCPNTPHFPIVYYGILKAGAVVVPLNVLLKPREIAYHLTDSDAKAFFCFEGSAELPLGQSGYAGFLEVEGCKDFVLLTADSTVTESPIEGAETFLSAIGGQPGDFDTALTEPTDTAVILYTSGTTGQPKGAELSHSNILMNVAGALRLFPVDPAHPETHLVTLPLFHSFGQTVQMNTGFSNGATLVLLPRFDAQQALALLDNENVTFFAGVPTMYWGLLQALTPETNVEKIAGHLTKAASGGAAIPVEIIREFKEKFGVDIQEGYGLSETSPVATFNHPERPTKPGSIGTPIWGIEVRLITDDWKTIDGVDEVGEIAIRGHNIMKGYYNRPEATAEVMNDGWFRTGDLAKRDEDGYYYIVDRVKDMIIRGGFNVYPRELEEVLLTHPAVSLVAVVGIPNESHGEEIKAYVIKNAGDATTEDELMAWCKENMASYKYPRIIEFRSELPMTATGKILKRELN